MTLAQRTGVLRISARRALAGTEGGNDAERARGDSPAALTASLIRAAARDVAETRRRRRC